MAENFTTEEKQLIDELKLRMADCSESYLQNDTYLWRWIYARKCNIDHAEAMLRNHILYRRTLKMDDPAYRHYKMHPVMKQYYTYGHCGEDKEGHPIIYYPFGSIDPYGMLSSVSARRVYEDILFVISHHDWLCAEQTAHRKKTITQCVLIIDLTGIGTKHLWKPGLDVIQQIATLLEEHMPESVYKMFLINAPVIFNVIWNVVKPMLNKRTQEKTDLFAENGWKSALLEIISPDQLPVRYGGTLVDSAGDGDCSQWIHYGGEIPRDFYFKQNAKIELEFGELTHCSVAHGSVLDVPITIERTGSKLTWYFKLAGHDIGFGIYQKVTEQAEKMVVPYFRVIATTHPEFGELIADSPSTYVLRFDNSYSKFFAKRLQYAINIDGTNVTVTQ